MLLAHLHTSMQLNLVTLPPDLQTTGECIFPLDILLWYHSIPLTIVVFLNSLKNDNSLILALAFSIIMQIKFLK